MENNFCIWNSRVTLFLLLIWLFAVFITWLLKVMTEKKLTCDDTEMQCCNVKWTGRFLIPEALEKRKMLNQPLTCNPFKAQWKFNSSSPVLSLRDGEVFGFALDADSSCVQFSLFHTAFCTCFGDTTPQTTEYFITASPWEMYLKLVALQCLLNLVRTHRATVINRSVMKCFTQPLLHCGMTEVMRI